MSVPLFNSLVNSVKDMGSRTLVAFEETMTGSVGEESEARDRVYSDWTTNLKSATWRYNLLWVLMKKISAKVTESFQEGNISDGIKKISIGVAQTIPQGTFTIADQ